MQCKWELENKRELKNIEGRQHVFVCEDLTPLQYKLLKYRVTQKDEYP